MAFLELAGLTKRFGAAAAVAGVDLSVEHGQLVSLLGPSGCGKTTMLRLIAGFVAPDGGEVRVGGKVLSRPGRCEPPERRRMSMIFQSYALWPHMTVFDNVAYGLRLRRFGSAELRADVEAILAATKLSEFAGRYPVELSGGQQQRVSLARALVVKPEILLLDEPLSNLDANLREEMRFEIRNLHDRYRYTTVYVTHDQTEAMTTADLIVVMNKGAIEQAGTPEDIYLRPRSEFVASFIGGTNILKGRRAGAAEVQLAGFALRCATGEFGEGEMAVSIHHHDIVLCPPAAEPGLNTTPGKVVRRTFLGRERDYLIRLPGGDTVRALVPLEIDVAAGEEVWLHFPPERCRALAR